MASNTFSFDRGVEPGPEPRADGTSPRASRWAKPKPPPASERLAKWPPDEPTGVADASELMKATHDTILRLLTSDIEAKVMCGVVANAVRLLQVIEKMKVDDEPESFFGGDS
jgi:hypothetical protein